MRRFERDLTPHHLDRDETPTDAEILAPLDAYGHLQWTVGNEDWLACIDFHVYAGSDEEADLLVGYHIVVDCESGGFIDTLKSGVVPWRTLVDHGCPLWQYADICAEHYAGNTEYPAPDSDEVAAAVESFSRALRAGIWRALNKGA